jgi:hypothetical protein
LLSHAFKKVLQIAYAIAIAAIEQIDAILVLAGVALIAKVVIAGTAPPVVQNSEVFHPGFISGFAVSSAGEPLRDSCCPACIAGRYWGSDGRASQSPQQSEDQDDEQNKAKATRRVRSPARRIIPSWKTSAKRNNQNHNQDNYNWIHFLPRRIN